MSCKILFTLALTGSLLVSNFAFGQEQVKRRYTRADFINIEGGNLNEKVERAFKQFKGSNQGDSVWIAYHFPARDGASIGPFGGMIYYDEGIKLERRDDPASAAVFLLTDATGSQPKFTRIKILTLSEPFVFENRQVYWLGDIEAAQSIGLIENLMRADKENRDLVRNALRAISVHQSPRVIPLLKEVATKETNLEIQRSAVSNLARIKSAESLETLINLYDTSTIDSLKEEIINGIARNDHRKAADKLLAIAKSDPNPKMRQRAIRGLSTVNKSSGTWVN